MQSYKQASDVAQDFIFKYIKDRMKHKNITIIKMAEILNISSSTLMRYFKKTTPMPLDIYFQICGVLELRPYLIPTELDTNEMNIISFN